MHTDTLIHARYLIPVVPRGILEHHSVAIQAGKIQAILPTTEATQQFSAENIVDLSSHIVIPGLINSHTHAAMNLLRGYADDMALHDWLENRIWPAEARWLSERFVEDGTQLAIAEMLRGGTTAFSDMYLFPDIAARCVLQSGIRACIGLVIIDFPTAWARDADDYLHKGLALADELKHEALVHTSFAPHAPYTVNLKTLRQTGTFANELELPIHIHLQETAREVADSMAAHQMRPTRYLESLGLVNPLLMAVHMTQTSDDDIELLHERGSHVIHCPESNMKLASGACPVAKLLARGVNVALGTDGAASNNDLDMFGEMRSAALLGKLTAGDAAAMTAEQSLEMATINGARAMNIEAQTGSLEVGKSADITAVSVEALEAGPLYNPVSHLVYSASRDHVTDVWVAGKQLLRNRQLTTLNETELREKSRQWKSTIASAEVEG